MDAEPSVAAFMAECYWAGVTQELVEEAAQRARLAASAMTADGRPVDLTGTVFVPGDEVVFYMFEGTSSEAVRAACERAELPFERIVESVWRPVTAREEES